MQTQAARGAGISTTTRRTSRSAGLAGAVALAVALLPASAQAVTVEAHPVAPTVVTPHVTTPPPAPSPAPAPSPGPVAAPEPSYAPQESSEPVTATPNDRSSTRSRGRGSGHTPGPILRSGPCLTQRCQQASEVAAQTGKLTLVWWTPLIYTPWSPAGPQARLLVDFATAGVNGSQSGIERHSDPSSPPAGADGQNNGSPPGPSSDAPKPSDNSPDPDTGADSFDSSDNSSPPSDSSSPTSDSSDRVAGSDDSAEGDGLLSDLLGDAAAKVGGAIEIEEDKKLEIS